MSELLHGTAVLAGARGVLIRGPSGAGKSTLALALIARGARLVADDRVFLTARNGCVVANAPEVTSGMIELRGRGIVPARQERSAIIRLVVDIVTDLELERMPEEDQFQATLVGIILPRQMVTNDPQRAMPLLEAGLAALSPHCNMNLRPAKVWG